LSTLWPASFKGVPFYFEADKETGGRGLVIHEFPNRDDPFIEDLGEAPRFYSGSAYVHGDNVDALANALKTALASRGPGTLVVPYFGPVTVHCQEFERSNEREKLGYIAFEAKFVRAGATSALISLPFLQNAAFIAAGNVAVALGSLFPASIVTIGRPDSVIGAVTDTLAGAAAAVDVLRQTYPTDPAVSAKLRDQVASFVATTVPTIDDSAAAASASASAVSALIGSIAGRGGRARDAGIGLGVSGADDGLGGISGAHRARGCGQRGGNRADGAPGRAHRLRRGDLASHVRRPAGRHHRARRGRRALRKRAL
jgi:hypothetical protein